MSNNIDKLIDIASNTEECISIPIQFFKNLKCKEALILAELLREYQHYKNQDGFDGWFPSTIENIESNCAIKRTAQDNAIDALIENEFIERKVKDTPATRHFRINLEKIIELLSGTEVAKTNIKEQPYIGKHIKSKSQEQASTNNQGKQHNSSNQVSVNQTNQSAQHKPTINEFFDFAEQIGAPLIPPLSFYECWNARNWKLDDGTYVDNWKRFYLECSLKDMSDYLKEHYELITWLDNPSADYFDEEFGSRQKQGKYIQSLENQVTTLEYLLNLDKEMV